VRDSIGTILEGPLIGVSTWIEISCCARRIDKSDSSRENGWGESIVFDGDGSVSMVHTTADVNFIDRAGNS